MKASRIALALLSTAALAACADSATITGADAPVRPAFNTGGFGMGSGGKDDSPTNESTVTTDTTTNSTVDRGGFGFGSGG